MKLHNLVIRCRDYSRERSVSQCKDLLWRGRLFLMPLAHTRTRAKRSPTEDKSKYLSQSVEQTKKEVRKK